MEVVHQQLLCKELLQLRLSLQHRQEELLEARQYQEQQQYPPRVLTLPAELQPLEPTSLETLLQRLQTPPSTTPTGEQ